MLRDAPGERHLLLGNEAIARGIIEAGVGVLSTYPGTPSSEIADTISAVAKEAGLYMEYSTNEIVALEVAAGAAMSGVRSVVCMKHVGLNVAADAFMTLAYTGVRAGMVVISADDPNAYSSQNEQDNRFYALLAG
ncbi:MAG: indolepyruvate ferredoxin oxidoreductase subunit alpha, partial [Thermoprotei archaeon]